MDNNQIRSETRFKDIDDLISGVTYALTLSRLTEANDPDRELLANYYTRYVIAGEVDVIEPMAGILETLIQRYDLLADPAKEPVRALLQMNGWQDVGDLRKACTSLLMAARQTKRGDSRALNELDRALQAANVWKLSVWKLTKQPLPFADVQRLVNAYNTVVPDVLKGEILDEGIEVDVKKSTD